MYVPKHIKAEDVFSGFSVIPGELERLIEERKQGIMSPMYDEWKKCDIIVLEEGLKLIQKRDLFDFLKQAGGFILFFLIFVFEAYLTINDMGRDSYTVKEAILVNLRMISLVAVAGLATAKLIHQDTSILPGTEIFQLKLFKAAVGVIIGTIIFLDLINLLVGA